MVCRSDRFGSLNYSFFFCKQWFYKQWSSTISIVHAEPHLTHARPINKDSRRQLSFQAPCYSILIRQFARSAAAPDEAVLCPGNGARSTRCPSWRRSFSTTLIYDLASLRHLSTSGSYIAPDLARRLFDRLRLTSFAQREWPPVSLKPEFERCGFAEPSDFSREKADLRLHPCTVTPADYFWSLFNVQRWSR